MSEEQAGDLLAMTAEIVESYVANNSVATVEVPKLIVSVHAALSVLGNAAATDPVETKPQAAVGIRKSLSNPAHIISMIDGKPYAMLTRHIKGLGYTPQTYRRTFGLPNDYPMTAPAYSEKRRTLAKAIGLGRRKAAPTSLPASGAKRPRSRNKTN